MANKKIKVTRPQILGIVLGLLMIYYAYDHAIFPKQPYPGALKNRIMLPLAEQSFHKKEETKKGPSSLSEVIQEYQLGKENPFNPTPSPLFSSSLGQTQKTFSSPFKKQNTDPAAPPQGTLFLKGLLDGEKPMALIQGENQEYFVKVGDRVGMYRVTAIQGESVTLTSKNGNTILTLKKEDDE